MSNRVVTAAILLVVGTGLAGCQGAGRALGLNPVAPDEFNVIAKAPLVLPPDYGLRPPAPGEPRPQELQPESRAREALLGQRQAEARSEGERLLVARAGAEKADPLIRYVIDDEYGDLAYKDKSFADKVMFWRKGQTSVGTGGTDSATPIDPVAEQQRIAALTGGKAVVIRRESAPRRKLPGL